MFSCVTLLATLGCWPMKQKFDLALFLELNEDYRSKPLVRTPPQYDASSLQQRSARKVKTIAAKERVLGKRVLEIGCGRGEVCRKLNETYGCEAVGVDVTIYPEWTDTHQDGVKLLQTDLSSPAAPDIGKFDIIYSNSVWEHVRHPYAMLEKSYQLLNPGGCLLLSANLYRGPKASHRYREVFFPWPHLLFPDEVFYEFYNHLGKAPARAAWVNQLSISDYLLAFDRTGFVLEHLDFSKTPLAEEFLERFADKLDRFPRYDLERDFIHAKLRKPHFGNRAGEVVRHRRNLVQVIRSKLQKLRGW